MKALLSNVELLQMHLQDPSQTTVGAHRRDPADPLFDRAAIPLRRWELPVAVETQSLVEVANGYAQLRRVRGYRVVLQWLDAPHPLLLASRRAEVALDNALRR